MDELKALLTAHDEQVRGHVPERAPVGAVVEQDGPFLRTHFSTHGTVRHTPLPADTTPTAAAELVHRQQSAFAARGEPVEWAVYGHDQVVLDEALRAAGFTATGPERTLLLADLDDVAARTGTVTAPRGSRVRALDYGYHRERELDRLIGAAGPYARALTDVREDHGNLLGRTLNVQLLEAETRLVGVGWAEAVGSTHFVALRGMTGPHAEFLPAWVRWARDSRALHMGSGPQREAPDRHYLVAEVPEGPIRDLLGAAGFRLASTVRTYSWTPPGPPPATTRPVSMLIGDRDHDSLCDAFAARFSFKPSTTYYPSIEEPLDSVTWHVEDVTDTTHSYRLGRNLPDDHRVARLQKAVERGLRACVRPGEELHSIDWYHQGYRFDPARVGGPGRPAWPGAACRDGDYYMLLTRDLRMGTFWHPWEESFCVFGRDLLAEVEDDLTAILGTVMRRGGRNTGNVWTFESSGDPD
ncbi:DUF2716 domain-containing protein [Actinacidiphila glaucinigra]|uniref:DUF2716 domain-containing protein n=1 Tax=Actinacidiphila glaucinigra TaxID=235986 RepID=UPI0033BB01F8